MTDRSVMTGLNPSTASSERSYRVSYKHMTSESQFSLFPKGGGQMRSALHGFEAITGELSNLVNDIEAQIGNFALFEISPDGLHGIEPGRTGGQARDGESPPCPSGHMRTLRLQRMTTPSQMINSGRLIWRLSAPRNSMTRSERIAPGKKRK